MGGAYFENQAGEVVAKTCTKCFEVKLMTELVNDKRREDGKSSLCKLCKVKGRSKHQANKKERERETKYREENREKVRDKARRFNEANPKKQYEYDVKWRKANPDKFREVIQRYTNTEEYRIQKKKYSLRWQRDNKEKLILNVCRRRARKAALPDTFTFEERDFILNHFMGACALTGSTDYHMDHVLPIACGHGGTIFENMIPLRDDLNSSKKASHIFEWFSSNRNRFNLSQEKFDSLVEYLAQVNEMTKQEYRAYVDWCFDNPMILSLPQ